MGRQLVSRPARFILFRRLWPDRNPLRRASDRAEAALVAGLAAVLLAGLPLAATFAAQWSYHTGLRMEHSEVGWREMPATLLANASTSPAEPGSLSLRKVMAVWTAPDGVQRAGAIPAPATAKPGSTVTIWVNAVGRLAATPLKHGQVEAQAVLTALLATVGFAVLMIGSWALARFVLNRRRLAGWDAAWRAIAPGWTARH